MCVSRILFRWLGAWGCKNLGFGRMPIFQWLAQDFGAGVLREPSWNTYVLPTDGASVGTATWVYRHWRPVAGDSFCTPCLRGEFNDQDAQGSCQKCQPGVFFFSSFSLSIEVTPFIMNRELSCLWVWHGLTENRISLNPLVYHHVPIKQDILRHTPIEIPL